MPALKDKGLHEINGSGGEPEADIQHHPSIIPCRIVWRHVVADAKCEGARKEPDHDGDTCQNSADQQAQQLRSRLSSRRRQGVHDIGRLRRRSAATALLRNGHARPTALTLSREPRAVGFLAPGVPRGSPAAA